MVDRKYIYKAYFDRPVKGEWIINRCLDYLYFIDVNEKPPSVYFHRERSFPLKGEKREVIAIRKVWDEDSKKIVSYKARVSVQYSYDYDSKAYGKYYYRMPERRIYSFVTGENAEEIYRKLLECWTEIKKMKDNLAILFDKLITIVPFVHSINYDKFKGMPIGSWSELVPLEELPEFDSIGIAKPCYARQSFAGKKIVLGKIQGLLNIKAKQVYGFFPIQVYVNLNDKVIDSQGVTADLVRVKDAFHGYGLYAVNGEVLKPLKRYFKVWRS